MSREHRLSTSTTWLWRARRPAWATRDDALSGALGGTKKLTGSGVFSGKQDINTMATEVLQGEDLKSAQSGAQCPPRQNVYKGRRTNSELSGTRKLDPGLVSDPGQSNRSMYMILGAAAFVAVVIIVAAIIYRFGPSEPGKDLGSAQNRAARCAGGIYCR